MRGYHDLGGLDEGPLDRTEHVLTQWEREVDAIRMLLADDQRRLLNGEEVRRVITSMGEDAYRTLSYYERWLHGFATLLLEKGTLSRGELEAATARAAAAMADTPDHGDHHAHTHHDHEGHAPDDEEHDPFRPESRHLLEAVKTLLIAKGILSTGEIRATIDFYDSRGAALGARAVARAWSDPTFKARLLAEPNAAMDSLGIDLQGTRLCVVESTPAVHNLIVCTLCSCYPRTLLGRPPTWYKSRAYRARAVRDPRGLLSEFGLVLDPAVSLSIHDSTADLRYMVLPLRPQGTEGLDEAALAGLVTRDSMIGTAVVNAPTQQAA